ncbi:MAG: sulfur oxidation c-type cytochrome SoxA [Gammaproteobacteria bacterium]|jgi:sulfur-oxidizing protein SoxA|nr:sulfur oxidation c-type cytochrome SoxA [Gammaproteobacteria bacterium]
MRYKSLTITSIFVLMAGVAGTAFTGENWGKYAAGEKRSGYTFMTPETRAMQDDDFANPAFLWVEQGQELWSKVEGEAGKSCASCHGDADKSMKGVGATYPVYAKELGKLINVEQRINQCRTERMKAKPWKYESSQLLGMTAYVKNQSRGMPVNPKIDGAAASFFERGKAFYNQRRGQLDMACMNCHVQHPGKMIRANRLSQGQPNAFPLYRLKWQKLGSLHRRFRGCNKQVRAEPYPFGSDEYVNLELYVMWRARGLPVEAPGVRM